MFDQQSLIFRIAEEEYEARDQQVDAIPVLFEHYHHQLALDSFQQCPLATLLSPKKKVEKRIERV